jgi:hypothetical protein
VTGGNIAARRGICCINGPSHRARALHNQRLVGNHTFNMTLQHLAIRSTLALALGLSFTGLVMAQTAPKPAKTGRAAPKAVAKAPVNMTPPAGPEQIDAAQRVYYGVYECELGQKVEIVADPKHEHYVDVKHAKTDFVMKPVLSSTGAIRLEDVQGVGLMVQIASKSMLLNTKTGQRIVDSCVSPKQRELMDANKAAETAAPK